jgi:hypothetical protein
MQTNLERDRMKKEWHVGHGLSQVKTQRIANDLMLRRDKNHGLNLKPVVTGLSLEYFIARFDRPLLGMPQTDNATK